MKENRCLAFIRSDCVRGNHGVLLDEWRNMLFPLVMLDPFLEEGNQAIVVSTISVVTCLM